MNEQAKEKLSKAIGEFLKNLLRIADEENYDRDSFVQASADMFATMTEISTFREYQLEG
jgi:hypothetical protein